MESASIMIETSKKISSETFEEITKKLENEEDTTCPLCESGLLKPITGNYKNCYCFVCDVCGQKLNIN